MSSICIAILLGTDRATATPAVEQNKPTDTLQTYFTQTLHTVHNVSKITIIVSHFNKYTGTSLLRASLQRGFGYKAVGTLDPNVLGIKGGRLQGQVIVLPTVYWFPFGTHAGRRIDL